ncbi:MAG: hypothetical protein GTN38_01125 [Candidatus Aenigmarchaeota archaeon]|nr:hypothetical protein [Candidatus Aenigmarchaeota archaeon]NIP40231.1 hypothetical protein [Candidatus Aenigmarchaeota archaeon]NIQ17496.1 hypothetical protein [Candidatus Aenigmarchaeota archaeon]
MKRLFSFKGVIIIFLVVMIPALVFFSGSIVNAIIGVEEYTITPLIHRKLLVNPDSSGVSLPVPVSVTFPSIVDHTVEVEPEPPTLVTLGELKDRGGDIIETEIVELELVGTSPIILRPEFELPYFPAESFFDVTFTIELGGVVVASEEEHIVLINEGDHGLPNHFIGETECLDISENKKGEPCSGETKVTVFCECRADHWTGVFCKDIDGNEIYRKDCIWEGPIISYSVQITEAEAKNIHKMRDACEQNMPDECSDVSGDDTEKCVEDAKKECDKLGATTIHHWDAGQSALSRVRGNSIWSGSPIE